MISRVSGSNKCKLESLTVFKVVFFMLGIVQVKILLAAFGLPQVLTVGLNLVLQHGLI